MDKEIIKIIFDNGKKATSESGDKIVAKIAATLGTNDVKEVNRSDNRSLIELEVRDLIVDRFCDPTYTGLLISKSDIKNIADKFLIEEDRMILNNVASDIESAMIIHYGRTAEEQRNRLQLTIDSVVGYACDHSLSVEEASKDIRAYYGCIRAMYSSKKDYIDNQKSMFEKGIKVMMGMMLSLVKGIDGKEIDVLKKQLDAKIELCRLLLEAQMIVMADEIFG